jgi:drug/metabolite transporter (DMT)-like permease
MLRYLASHDYLDGYTTNLVRYPISTVLYIPLIVMAVRRGGLGRFWWTALLPAVVNVIGQTFFAISPYYLPAGIMSFLVRISVVWSILGAFVFFPEERRLGRLPRFWTGAALALAGFALMSWSAMTNKEVTILGAALILLCSIFWGLYDVTVRYTMRDLHPLVVFGVIGNYTSIGLILLAPMGEPSSLRQLPAWPMALLITSAFIGIAAAHGMYYVAIQRLGVAVSALTLLATPFISVLGEAIFLDQRFSGWQWAGGLVLIVGATLALWSRQQASRPPEKVEGVPVQIPGVEKVPRAPVGPVDVGPD